MKLSASDDTISFAFQENIDDNVINFQINTNKYNNKGQTTMESVEKHIEVDKKILEDPTTSPQQRRHIEEELHELEVYVENHKKEIADGDHHDPTALELS